MLIFITIAAALTLLPIAGLWPRLTISESEGPRNGLFLLRMPRADNPLWSGQSRRGVMAQEVVEQWLAAVWTVLIAAPLAFALRDLPGYGAIPCALIVPVHAVLRRWSWSVRQLELIGHAAEVVVAEEEFGRIGYLLGEAESVHQWHAAYGSAFAGMSIIQIADAMAARRPLARVLVRLLALSIRRINKK